jgi:hypothetical protein
LQDPDPTHKGNHPQRPSIWTIIKNFFR